jgi:hypothetical protein
MQQHASRPMDPRTHKTPLARQDAWEGTRDESGTAPRDNLGQMLSAHLAGAESLSASCKISPPREQAGIANSRHVRHFNPGHQPLGASVEQKTNLLGRETPVHLIHAAPLNRIEWTKYGCPFFK